MRIEREIAKLDIAALRRPSELTDTARQVLVSLCASLGQSRFFGVEAPVMADFPCRELLEQLIDSLPLDNAASLLLANDAVYTRTLFLSDHRYNYVLDRTFDYLDTALGLTGDNAPSPVDLQTAMLLAHVFSVFSLSEEDEAPYLSALRSYIEAALPRLDAELLPLNAVPCANTEALTEARVEKLVEQMDTISLIFESSFLFDSAYRPSALHLLDILRRQMIFVMSDLGLAIKSEAEQPENVAWPSLNLEAHTRLLAAYSRMAVADMDAAPFHNHQRRAHYAAEGLDALNTREATVSDASASAHLLSARLTYLSVLASATITYLNARQNEATYNPFE